MLKTTGIKEGQRYRYHGKEGVVRSVKGRGRNRKVKLEVPEGTLFVPIVRFAWHAEPLAAPAGPCPDELAASDMAWEGCPNGGGAS